MSKALVCVFLNGGNDGANSLVPYDDATHAQYAAVRGALAVGRDALAATVLNPDTPLPDGVRYALNPALAPLLPIFEAGHMAPLLNVGALIEPVTKAQYDARSVRLPPKLFSHNDQMSFVQSSSPEGAASGWGGRIGDIVMGLNANPALTCINMHRNAVFLSGKRATQYGMGENGPVALNGNRPDLFGSVALMAALRKTITAPREHLFENEHARIVKRSLDTYSMVSDSLKFAPPIKTVFDPKNSLASQLKMVARMISVGERLGMKRQIFFVQQTGYDLHDVLNIRHPQLLATLASALRSFHDATVEMGIADQATTFTMSDFGRTLVPNTDGSDHGWGTTNFMIGGAVKGRQIYGRSPVFADNGPDDAGQGRMIPTISIDQYAATLATWFGVSDTQMAGVLPNIGNYPVRDLGFMSATEI